MMQMPLHASSRLAPWRWRDGLWGLLIGAGWSLALFALQPRLLQAWNAVVTLWSQPLGLALTPLPQDAPPPSETLLLTTTALVALLYVLAGHCFDYSKQQSIAEPENFAERWSSAVQAGLGLAISKGFVEAMGGRIAAASPIHDGRGTRILISLPKERATPIGLM